LLILLDFNTLLNNIAAGIGFAKNVLEDHKSRAPDSSIDADFRNQKLNHVNRLAFVGFGEGNPGFHVKHI
jgi:hypothetical protein